MRIKDIFDETYQDYKKPSMLIATCMCDWKCCRESGRDNSLCQNSSIARQKTIDIPDEEIVERYMNNPLTHSVIVGGLEPFLQFDELLSLISKFREATDDDIVIYTGYYESEVEDLIQSLSVFENIIIKFGRFIPNDTPRYDEVLGVTLSSKNQYAKRNITKAHLLK